MKYLSEIVNVLTTVSMIGSAEMLFFKVICNKLNRNGNMDGYLYGVHKVQQLINKVVLLTGSIWLLIWIANCFFDASISIVIKL